MRPLVLLRCHGFVPYSSSSTIGFESVPAVPNVQNLVDLGRLTKPHMMYNDGSRGCRTDQNSMSAEGLRALHRATAQTIQHTRDMSVCINDTMVVQYMIPVDQVDQDLRHASGKVGSTSGTLTSRSRESISNMIVRTSGQIYVSE
jgi:hypothetical protein